MQLFFFEFEDIIETIRSNNRSLNTIVKDINGRKSYYILASLLNNAKRRADDCKYDDAIARLYRSLELIAQISLEKYRINSSNVDIDIVKEHCSNEKFMKF